MTATGAAAAAVDATASGSTTEGPRERALRVYRLSTAQFQVAAVRGAAGLALLPVAAAVGPRGPVGVDQLTTFKYRIHGNGQIRP